MNKIIEDYKKIVAGNEAGKNICFMSRGEYADPKIAYNGILMNYWDVYDCMDEIPPISLALEGDRGILNIGEFKRKEIDYEQK